MSEQLPLLQVERAMYGFNRVRALQAKLRGMEQALEADRVAVWREIADAWLEAQPQGHTFTADDMVWDIGLPSEGVYKNNAVGAWFGAQSRARKIEWTGEYRKSARVIGHGNPQRVWRVR